MARKAYGYFPGCVAQESCRELYQATAIVADKLDFDLIELKAASCCGASVVNDMNRHLARMLNARTFAEAEALGLDTVLTICSTCTGHMRQANHELVNTERYMTEANEVLKRFGRSYSGKVTTKHMAWIIRDDVGIDKLKSMVVRPLTGMKIGAFYGCHVLRPEEYAASGEDPRNPHNMEDLIVALGAEPIVYDGRTKCCGFHIQLEREEVTVNLVGKNMAEARDQGAESIVTGCPLCHLALDAYQTKSGPNWGKTDLPVFHLPQLIALALGVPPDKLGLKKHLTDTSNILAQIQLAS
jgi:succinate dehydrogenase / fumarate reductase cytochrome b subunit